MFMHQHYMILLTKLLHLTHYMTPPTTLFDTSYTPLLFDDTAANLTEDA